MWSHDRSISVSQYINLKKLIHEDDFWHYKSVYMSKVQSNAFYDRLLEELSQCSEINKITIWNSTLSEKFFSAMKKGKWVIHKLEIKACSLVSNIKYKLNLFPLKRLRHLAIHSEPIGNKLITSLFRIFMNYCKSIYITNTKITNDCLRFDKIKQLNLM
jgi:hypothetical protein